MKEIIRKGNINIVMPVHSSVRPSVRPSVCVSA